MNAKPPVRTCIRSCWSKASIPFTMASQYPCVVCSSDVRKRQEALLCDNCNAWQHRTCGTGISRDDYRRIVKGEMSLLRWHCSKCPAPGIGRFKLMDWATKCLNISLQSTFLHSDGLVQERRNSSALVMELRLPCINDTALTHQHEVIYLEITLHLLRVVK